MANLILFDFDGTITKKDSMIEFLKFSFSKKDFLIKSFLFTPTLLLYKIKLIDNQKAKENLIYHFFKDWSEEKFKHQAKNFSKKVLPQLVYSQALEMIQKYQKNGDKVVIVSASFKCWLEPWCKQHNVDLLCTELNFHNNKVSNRFKTPNCYGKEKVNRILQKYQLNDYHQIYAYGDSHGDDQMLALADKMFYRYFRN